MSGKPGIPVLVTGFGPFGEHKINISWEIAKVLQTFKLESYGINLITEEIPVVYSFVSQEVPSLWKKYKPQLVVHMGVGLGTEIYLETVAYKDGYFSSDITGKCPPNGSANGEKKILRTGLNVKLVSDNLNNSTEIQVPIRVSSDAGRYVCEFIFYTSLNVNTSRTAFVHVPDFNRGSTVLQMAEAVKHIILLLLKQVTLTKPSIKYPINEESEVFSANEIN